MKKNLLAILVLSIITCIVGIYAFNITFPKKFKPLTEKQALSEYVGGMRYQLADFIEGNTEGYSDEQLDVIEKAYKEHAQYVSAINKDRKVEITEINKSREKTYKRIGTLVLSVFTALITALFVMLLNLKFNFLSFRSR